jgi:hypothetical protein
MHVRADAADVLDQHDTLDEIALLRQEFYRAQRKANLDIQALDDFSLACNSVLVWLFKGRVIGAYGDLIRHSLHLANPCPQLRPAGGKILRPVEAGG